MSGQCVCDGIYPAVQFHLRIERDEPLTTREIAHITEAIKIPMSGFVAVEFRGRRILITSTVPPEQQESLRDQYIEAIEGWLGA